MANSHQPSNWFSFSSRKPRQQLLKGKNKLWERDTYCTSTLNWDKPESTNSVEYFLDKHTLSPFCWLAVFLLSWCDKILNRIRLWKHPFFLGTGGDLNESSCRPKIVNKNPYWLMLDKKKRNSTKLTYLKSNKIQGMFWFSTNNAHTSFGSQEWLQAIGIYWVQFLIPSKPDGHQN